LIEHDASVVPESRGKIRHSSKLSEDGKATQTLGVSPGGISLRLHNRSPYRGLKDDQRQFRARDVGPASHSIVRVRGAWTAPNTRSSTCSGARHLVLVSVALDQVPRLGLSDF
jgi:hypothetical protein